VPIIQFSLSSKSLSDTELNDLGQNIIRPDLAIVRGADVPQPYGGNPPIPRVPSHAESLDRSLDILEREMA
jgi:hypothetical protein